MDKIRVVGGNPLRGKIHISGAKNAALPLMATALLTDQPVTLNNVPNLFDIITMRKLLESLGVVVATDGNTLTLDGSNITNLTAEYDLVRKMRASVLVLGPLLARFGKAVVSLPGGCAIGTRPIDIHLKALTQLGAKIDLKEGYVEAEVDGKLQGAEICFDKVSVGATENLLMAASLAEGTTVLKNAAREPEIGDLAECLNAMGAKIEGIGTDTLTIEGVDSLHSATHAVIEDRIEAGTYAVAAAITGGDIELLGVRENLLDSFFQKLRSASVNIEATEDGIRVSANEPIVPVDIVTQPYPGFPTDLQAQFMALMCLADGTSLITENIFENRFMHVSELRRMGADIVEEGRVAKVNGVSSLKGAPVMATDLRASVSLILAALAAEGETLVNRVYHLDRGYEKIEEKLHACGAEIERVSE